MRHKIGSFLARWGRRVGPPALLLAVVVLATVAGLRARRAAWAATDGAHFRGDISSGWRWGDRALQHGLFSFYDDLDADVRAHRDRRNDYAPLRLTAMTAWTRWTQARYPDARGWQDDYDFTAPLLRANTAAEAASAALVFTIIRLLKVRMAKSRAGGLGDGRPRPGPYAGVAAGMAGALLFWFNPAVIWDGHCWPQWDVWLMPPMLAGILAACVDAWFTAGACVVVGAFLKGQVLLGAPVLLLWPLFGGRVGAALRLACGAGATTAALALPWMRPGTAAWVWCATTAAAGALVFEAARRRDARPAVRAMLAVAALLLAWPWASAAPWRARLLAGVPIALAAAASALPARWRLRLPLLALAAAAAVLLTMPLFGASATWFTMGFAYGTEKFAFMLTGSGSWNVPAMAVHYLDWSRNPAHPVAVPGLARPVAAKTLWRAAYAATLLLCGAAAAAHDRRRDTRLLAALVAPWLLFFMLMTQMHGRYSVWAAGFSALLAGTSVGLTLLGVLVGAVATLGIVENQLLFVPQFAPDTLALLERLDPHLGWLLLLSAAIYLYAALTPGAPAPSPRPSRPPEPASVAP